MNTVALHASCRRNTGWPLLVAPKCRNTDLGMVSGHRAYRGSPYGSGLT